MWSSRPARTLSLWVGVSSDIEAWVTGGFSERVSGHGAAGVGLS